MRPKVYDASGVRCEALALLQQGAHYRYKKLLSSVDLTKDFFYSYTYPIMQSLQKNVLSMGEDGMPFENIFVWNAFLTESIRSRCKNTIWTIALVHGHFKQTRLSIFGRDFSVSLISRRSRHFAGTRYLKRGVNDRGRVANDVETEQIVLDEEAGSCKGKMSSIVQMRGSIPLFWSQEASRFSPKPDIILQRDMILHMNQPNCILKTWQRDMATQLLFLISSRKKELEPLIEKKDCLAIRESMPIMRTTVEKRPREMMLRREFANAVGYLNQILSEENHLKFIHWDFHKFAKSKSANVLAVLGGVASEALDLTGFYYSGKPIVLKKKATQLSRTSTGRDASLRDMKVNSGDLGRIGSSNDVLDSLMKQDREPDSSEQINKDNFGGAAPHFQSGVLRTNCIDCVDRTNVAQYAYGLAALGRQLRAMGLTDKAKVDADSSIAAALMDMYQSMGDALAQQYGGSAAHNTVFTERQGKWKATAQSREFLKSIKRYYSNAYTDGEKQDAINLYLSIPPLFSYWSIILRNAIQACDAIIANHTEFPLSAEGKPALWELDSDYYLHVSGIGDDLVPYNSSPVEATPMGARTTLSPIPACREDFSRIKLTSFDKLIERTCSLIRNVRLCSEPDQRPGNSGVAPDAAEIQLKTPNWLFGQRKFEESNPASKAASQETVNGRSQIEKRVDDLYDLNWLSSSGDDIDEEDVFKRYLAMTSVDEANGWYGGTLLGDQDEDSEIYKHYAELCQGPAIEPFQHDAEKEKYYADLLGMGAIDAMDSSAVEAEMEAALKEYDQIGADLGIFPKTCQIFG
ncbi:phosphoinositide phosphatase family protein [Actinidia rufa]|uniref:Phosphoinositide phosphatase family protein n=1 Tax=Actinidia rufa TaxID=165716 RepID=A0A7J0GNB0_9ERIC|nr:phosphoinositide phosphatase family protein [Actinidia rufa]